MSRNRPPASVRHENQAWYQGYTRSDRNSIPGNVVVFDATMVELAAGDPVVAIVPVWWSRGAAIERAARRTDSRVEKMVCMVLAVDSMCLVGWKIA